MRLTTMPWRLTLLGACAAALALALQFGEAEERPYYLRRARERTLYAQRVAVRDAMIREANAYTDQQLIAIADHADVSTPDTSDVTVVAIDSAGRAILPMVREAISRERSTLALGAGGKLRSPLRVLVSRSPREALPPIVGMGNADALVARYARLPRHAGEPCTLLLTVRNLNRDRIVATLSSGRGVLGPCAFFVAFGLPGAALRAHLDSAQWNPAAFARWNDAADDDEEARQPWSDLSANGARCLARGDAACARTWSEATHHGRWLFDDERPTAVVAAQRLVGPLPWHSVHGSALGVRQGLALSDLVREVGPAKFGEAWRRDVPVDAVFHSLVGMDESAWLSRWLARSYARVSPSPRPARAETTWWLLVVAGSAAALTGVRERRGA
ncbi:MAG: hypothetical protein IPN16_01670 [Gemmatimonadetes bacterium]|nr:hypothetical protein [Gemmatimonadota bacterium]